LARPSASRLSVLSNPSRRVLFVDNRDGNVKILQIVHQGSMVVTSHFEQDLDLSEWDKRLDAINE
jgi:hypothetical protein